MNKHSIYKLIGWEEDAYLWIEQESSIMVKVVNKYGDPIELTSLDARNLAKLLIDAANKLDLENN